MKLNAGPYITREGVADALARPVPRVLKARAEALENQATQCERFYPWPALSESLRADALRLRVAMRAAA